MKNFFLRAFTAILLSTSMLAAEQVFVDVYFDNAKAMAVDASAHQLLEAERTAHKTVFSTIDFLRNAPECTNSKLLTQCVYPHAVSFVDIVCDQTTHVEKSHVTTHYALNDILSRKSVGAQKILHECLQHLHDYDTEKKEALSLLIDDVDSALIELFYKKDTFGNAINYTLDDLYEFFDYNFERNEWLYNAQNSVLKPMYSYLKIAMLASMVTAPALSASVTGFDWATAGSLAFFGGTVLYRSMIGMPLVATAGLEIFKNFAPETHIWAAGLPTGFVSNLNQSLSSAETFYESSFIGSSAAAAHGVLNVATNISLLNKVLIASNLVGALGRMAKILPDHELMRSHKAHMNTLSEATNAAGTVAHDLLVDIAAKITAANPTNPCAKTLRRLAGVLNDCPTHTSLKYEFNQLFRLAHILGLINLALKIDKKIHIHDLATYCAHAAPQAEGLAFFRELVERSFPNIVFEVDPTAPLLLCKVKNKDDALTTLQLCADIFIAERTGASIIPHPRATSAVTVPFELIRLSADKEPTQHP